MKTNKPAENTPQTKPCRKYFKKLDRICGDKYGYFKNEKRNYIKKKTDFDLWICPTCEKIKDKPAEISLSDKIFQGRKLLSIYHHNKPMILAEDIKEAIQKILERIEKMEKTAETNEQKCSLQSVIEIISSEMGDKLI